MGNYYDELLKNAINRGRRMSEKHLLDMEEQQGDVLILKVIEFLRQNPNPDDDKVHAFAEQLGIDPHKLEAVFYKLATNFSQLGKHRDVPDEKFDPEQLKMGISVEKEHTDCPLLAREIAADHLSECPRYYSFLKEMEKKCKS